MARALGKLETQFFAFIQAEGLLKVRTGDLTRGLGLGAVQERKLLSRLCRAGLIARVRRGLYLVPSRIPPGGKWSPGEFLALSALMDDQDARYQLCGPSAFGRYGWDDQVPNRVYAYNNRVSGDRRIGPLEFSLIHVADQRLGGTEAVKTPEGITIFYSSRARSLMDAVCDWSRFNTLPRAYGWIRAELARDGSLARKLIDMSLRHGNQGTLRRIGKLLETEGAPQPLLRKLEKAIRRSSSLIPWIPTRPKRGRADKRWGVIFNDVS